MKDKHVHKDKIKYTLTDEDVPDKYAGEQSVNPWADTNGSNGHTEPGGLTYTVDDAIEHVGFGKFQLMMLFYTGLAWIGDAMEMMLLSFIGPALSCYWKLSKDQESWITSVVFIGMVFGAFCWGSVADVYGRKKGFFATALFTAIWGLASALAPSYGAFLFFRMMVGFGLGGVPVAYALFMEFIPAGSRGLWLVVIEFFWTIGTLFEAGIAWAVLPTAGWRWLLGVSTVPLILLMTLFPFLPESPRFLALKGDLDSALVVLKRLAKVNRKPLPIGTLVGPAKPQEDIDPNQIPQLGCAGLTNKTLSAASTVVQSFQKLFSRRLMFTSLLLVVIWFTNALAYYGLVLLATELHAQDGKEPGNECDPEDDRKPALSVGDYGEIFATSSGEMIGLLFAALFVEVIGRKRTMAISLICTALFITPLLAGNNATVFFFFSRAFAMASFTIIYIYTPEVYPTYVRSFGLGFNNSIARIGGLVAPFLSVDLVGHNQADVAEGLIMMFCFISAIFTCLLPIETKGRHLRDTGEVEMTEVTFGGGDARNDNNDSNMFDNIRNSQLEGRVPFQREDPIAHI